MRNLFLVATCLLCSFPTCVPLSAEQPGKDDPRARLDSLSRRIDADSDDWVARLERAGRLADLDRYEEALIDLAHVIRIRPTEPYAYVQRGALYLRLKAPLKALLDYNRALSNDSKCYPAYVNRSSVYALLGSFDDALRDCDSAIRLKSDDPNAYFNRAVIHLQRGDHDKSIGDLDKAEKFCPKSSYSLTLRAVCLNKKRDYGHADELFQKAAATTPLFDSTLREYAWFLATCPDPKYRNGGKAVELAQAASKLAHPPMSADLLEALAAAYAETGAFEKAIHFQEKALASPRSSGLIYNTRAAEARLELYQSKTKFREGFVFD
ncbi:MAG: tetratricopeptide repeat protein [Gemmataceae bacterium]